MADLSLSKQCNIVLLAEQMWQDSQNQTEQYHAEAETIKALKANQEGRVQFITSIEDPSLEDDQVKVVWIDNCDSALDDNCQDVCDFTANDAPLNSKNYTLNNCKSASFSVDENDLRRNRYSFDDYVARQLLYKTKLLDEYLNLQSLTFLSASAGWNKNQETYTFNGDVLRIPPSEYNMDLLVKLIVDAKYNLIDDAFVVDSGHLYKSMLLADLEKGDSDGPGAFAKSKLFNTTFDLVGFANAGISENTFLVKPASYAIASRNYNPTAPTVVNPKSGWQQRFTVPSRNIPGVAYDVYYDYECSDKRFVHKWYIEVNFGFFLNPEGCDVNVGGDQVTGILAYQRTGTPES